jgi:two-component system chemotaxis sensor kinase CheA
MAQAAPTKAQAQAKADKPQVPATERGGGTIRINVSILDKLMTLAGELVLVRNQQLMSMERSDAANRDITQRLDIVTTELQGTIMRTRMQPIGNVLGKLPRIVRDLSMKLGKQITLDIKGNEVELDKTILESLTDPLTHIIRNCCDHGIEKPKERELAGKPPTGTVKVSAFHEAGQINIVIKDDGRGINPEKVGKSVVAKGLKSEADLAQMTDKEILNLIMLPGFSTAEQISDVSGRGVGMDVVKHSIEELGGSVELESWHGQGTSLHLRLPLTLAIIPCLIVKVDEHRFAIPQVNLVELVCLYDEEVHNKIEVAGIQEVYRLRDRLLPMVRLHEVLERPVPFTRDTKAGIAEKHRRRSARKLAEWEHRRAAERGRPEDGAKEDEASSADETAQAAQAAAGNGGQAGTSRMVQPVEDSASMETLNFAVVKVGADRFGLIVDQVLGTEEIVVKPLHPALKSLRCYSGATVMGDGAVSLILDIEGIARHAGVSLEQLSDEIVSQTAAGASRLDTQSILLFQSGRKEQFALALPLIRRIERIGMQQVEQVGQKEFITVDGVSTLVLRLDKFLSVSPCEERQEMFLILPKYCHQPFGILMSRIIDIEEAAVHLNTESYSEDGLLGTDIIRGHLTLFPDIYRLIEKAEPQWFADRKRMAPSDGKKRVLLLEDSSFMRLMVQKYLESDGYDVTPAEDGRQALERMHEHDFDIVVSDIEMPVMDGLEYIKNVRMGARQRDIPAIALTALNTDYDRDRALGYGFDGYQVKIDRERFLAEVARLLNTRHEPQVSHAD